MTSENPFRFLNNAESHSQPNLTYINSVRSNVENVEHMLNDNSQTKLMTFKGRNKIRTIITINGKIIE